MAKITRDIALTRTPTSYLIHIPKKIVKDMDISTDSIVQVKYDTETKEMKLTKIKE